MIRLLRLWIRAGVMVDALWAKEASHLGTIIRYADDAVVLCGSKADAQAALQWLQRTAEVAYAAL